MSCRFFEPINLLINHKFILSQENSHKIISVLKLPIGSTITIFNNTNIEFIATIIELKIIKKIKLIEVKILQVIKKNLESPLKIHLAQAIAKHDNMDLIVQKAVELGVNQITPIITERTIVRINNNQITKKTEHWQSIAINACCQCGRNIIPTINHALLFNNFINDQNNNKNKFILSTIPNKTNNHLTNLNTSEETILLIGPEGGFSPQELGLAEQNKFFPINLGPRILRTETAPIVALSIFQAKYGDFA